MSKLKQYFWAFNSIALMLLPVNMILNVIMWQNSWFKALLIHFIYVLVALFLPDKEDIKEHNKSFKERIEEKKNTNVA